MGDTTDANHPAATDFDAADDHRTLHTTATPMQVWRAWAEPEHVARWFADDARGTPEPRLELPSDAGGGSLTGRLLADSGRELAVSWDEIDGALEIKAFDMGPNGRAVCLRGCGWGMGPDEARRIESEMEAALERLAAQL